MKYPLLSLLIVIALISCSQTERIDPMGNSVKIDPAVPPSGMLLVQILLENMSLPVKGTGCQSGVGEDKRRLQHTLAMTLGEGLDNLRHRTELLGGCVADQFEFPSGSVIDIWNCKLGAVEKDIKGEFIASTHIRFGIKKDTWEFVPEKLRCT